MSKYKDIVENRKLTNLHIVLTSIVSALANFGILNQGCSNIIGYDVGRKIAKYIKETSNNIPQKEDELIDFIIKYCEISDDYIITNNKIGIKIDKCKYCPKQIGEAEISGSACILPALIISCLSELKNKEYKLKYNK
ncbi:hypothetical protein ACPB8Q_07895 [Methanocaldococcus indicus]|uniref:hypothetical protein n=1 Tax=Methanocaldococcus indicus TaxID=213231 RepID=UPI003C6D465A